jgi:nucleoside 2-deoxyribosyltransferase-like protein
MQYIGALTEYEPDSRPAVFLAGGITGCVEWQKEIVVRLNDLPVVLLNPRRANFPIDDPTAAPQQIEWEHRHLHKADAITFWFPCETLCPITLYELGAWSVYRDERGPRPLFVGVHPEYQRRQDVEIQTRLVRPEVEIVYSLTDLAECVKRWVPSLRGRQESKPAERC